LAKLFTRYRKRDIYRDPEIGVSTARRMIIEFGISESD
jgi:hypothetical protein